MTTNIKNQFAHAEPTGQTIGRAESALAPGLRQSVLNALIGKWTTHRGRLGRINAPVAEPATNDVYEWVAGGFFVVHSEYAPKGQADVRVIKIIGYDATNRKYRSNFFDSHGKTSSQVLMLRGRTWIWTAEKICSNANTRRDTKQ